jgi:phage anti-repressor protein/regulator of replication initiation timing
MDASFNIVDLIENNPITRLTNTYQNNLLTKIKANFTDNEQQLFVASFYSFLNYDSTKDFVIDFDNVWKWLGFLNKANSKRLLEKQFIINKDYKILLIFADEQKKHIKGGHNKETIMLNVETFKKFCMKAGTKKADEIHDYYIRLEQTLQEVIHEESTELKLQLEQQSVELQHSQNANERIREKTLVEQFANNTQCVYYGLIDNVGDKNEKLIKFGNSNNLKTRVTSHKGTYNNFRLMNAFKVTNKLQIGNAIKEHVLFIERHQTITIKNKKYIEIINADGLLLSTLDKTIKDIIVSIECTPENYTQIIGENKMLKKQLEQLNKKLEKYEKVEEEQPVVIKPRAFTRNKDGGYTVDGNIYETLIGSRTDVFEGKSYKTTGGLKKTDLIINKYGKILSKNKSIEGKINNRLDKVNQSKMTKLAEPEVKKELSTYSLI